MTIQEYLEQLLAHMGCSDATIALEEKKDDVGGETLSITIQASEADSGMLIGRRGETLLSIQRMVAATFREELGSKRVSVDINQYRERRSGVVQQMALEVADRVKETDEPETLPHLSGEERRIVHMALRDAGVVTQSSGEGDQRRLTVYPEGYALPAQDAS